MLAVTNPPCGTSVPLPPSAAFGLDECWVRARFKLGKENGKLRSVFEASYAEHPAALQMYLPDGKNEVVFASRNAGGWHQPVHRKGYLTPGLVHEFTGIRRGNDLFLSMDGLPPERACIMGRPMSLDTPRKLVIGQGFTGTLLEVSLGRGRPRGFNGALTREELFRK